MRDGELVWTGAAGGRDGFVPGPDVQYRIGSITKTLVAVLVMQLRDEGALDLNDRLDEHLPGIAYGDRTLRDLLAHATGMHSEPAGSWWSAARAAASTSSRRASEEDAPFAPGATFHYTNVALRPARRGGRPAPRAARGSRWSGERILEPLGMRRTTYLPEAPHATGFSVHHYAGTLTEEPAHDAGAMAPAGQVWSTVEDLCRYGAFLATGDERVMSPPPPPRCARPRRRPGPVRSPTRTASGSRWCRGGSGMLVGHTGSMPGFLAGCFADPRRRTAAVVFANATVGMRCQGLAVDLLETLEKTEGTSRWVGPERPRPGPGRGRCSASGTGGTPRCRSLGRAEVVVVPTRSGPRRRIASCPATTARCSGRAATTTASGCTSNAGTTARSTTWCARRSSTRGALRRDRADPGWPSALTLGGLFSSAQDEAARHRSMHGGGMRTRVSRRPPWSCARSRSHPFLVSCGSGDKAPSDFCKSVATLSSAVTQINQSALSKSTLAAVGDSLHQIEAAAKNLTATAKSQFPSEVAAVESGATALKSSVTAAVHQPTPSNVNAARTSMRSFTSSVNSLSSATSSSC